jgi:AraC-like DNA-binding protein
MAQNEGLTLTDDFLIKESTLIAPLATMHYHNSYELYYVVKGERDYFVGDQFFKAYNNNIVLVPQGIPHRTAGKGATRILIHFTDEFLLNFFSEEIINNLLLAYQPTVLTPSKEENEELQILFKKMIAEYEKIENKSDIKSYTATSIPLFVFELLHRLRYGNFSQTNDTTSDKRINEIVRYINENFASIESIDDVSELFFISKYHLCRTWKKNLGISLISYINMIKIRSACRMIENTDEKITDIAMRCGFNSSAYFCKVFKEEIGCSPREYKLSSKKKI